MLIKETTEEAEVAALLGARLMDKQKQLRTNVEEGNDSVSSAWKKNRL